MTESQNQLVQRYKYLHYVCSACKAKRYVTLSKFMHLNRQDLKTKGLALYIDVHRDQNDPQKREHGVKLQVDAHYHVRANDVLQFRREVTLPAGMKAIPGIPMPKLTISEVNFTQPTISWNYLQLDSHSHNMSLRMTNNRENIKEEQEVNLVSPLGVAYLTMKYNSGLLSDEYLQRTKRWLNLVLKWIELSSSVDVETLVPLLRFVDQNHGLEPAIQDELSISLLLDDSALIRLNEQFTKVDQLFKSRVSDYSGLYPMAGLNEYSTRYITKILNTKKFVYIKEFVNNLGLAGGDNKMEYLDSFIHLFFDLNGLDAFEYRVSYFT